MKENARFFNKCNEKEVKLFIKSYEIFLYDFDNTFYFLIHYEKKLRQGEK